ncbi:cytochrome p450 [Moniliophthora roreri]|nr:cytochrome p450 [Moniliophthora roreri]
MSRKEHGNGLDLDYYRTSSFDIRHSRKKRSSLRKGRRSLFTRVDQSSTTVRMYNRTSLRLSKGSNK